MKRQHDPSGSLSFHRDGPHGDIVFKHEDDGVVVTGGVTDNWNLYLTKREKEQLRRFLEE